MIIVGGKLKGKKLVNAIVRELNQHGHAKVAALSDQGVHRINSAGQKVSNQLGMRVKANPHEGEVTIDGVHRVALIVDLQAVSE